MGRAVELAALVGADTVDHALGLAAIAGRFADTDLASILDHLAAAGAQAPTFEVAWLEYRRHSFYGYIAWAFPIGRAFYHPKWQPDEYCLAILERSANAIVDLDAFAAL
jgi:hypothetical protein